MNYYIQGDAAKADQIKAAFESKEIRVPHYRSCGDNSLIYFSLNKEVLAVTIKALELFEDNPDYKELELLVEPKFKVGDWIVGNEGVFKITQYEDEHGYYLTDTTGCVVHFVSPDYVESNFHLWSIEDAKDGDVICTPNNNIFIYKCKGSGAQIYDYCGLYHGKFEPDSSSPNGAYNSCDGYAPATMEQCDLLFVKMREAGYEWDADKRELRKVIEPNFKVGDWIVHIDGNSYVPIQVYGLKKDRYLVTNMLGSKGQVMINRQDEWHLWTIQDAKEGDVLVDEYNNIGLYSGEKDDLYWHSCIYFGCDEYLRGSRGYHKHKNTKPATKEQRDLLFAKMKEAGYQWNVDKKELRKIKPHYDIANFKPMQWVLVRNCDNQTWCLSIFSHMDMGFYVCINLEDFRQCIPLEGNEKLLGTTDMPSEEYINW